MAYSGGWYVPPLAPPPIPLPHPFIPLENCEYHFRALSCTQTILGLVVNSWSTHIHWQIDQTTLYITVYVWMHCKCIWFAHLIRDSKFCRSQIWYSKSSSCSIYNVLINLIIEPHHEKQNEHVRRARTQLRLGIRPVWSESSMSALTNLGSLATRWAHSEDW